MYSDTYCYLVGIHMLSPYVLIGLSIKGPGNLLEMDTSSCSWEYLREMLFMSDDLNPNNTEKTKLFIFILEGRC